MRLLGHEEAGHSAEDSPRGWLLHPGSFLGGSLLEQRQVGSC